MSSNTIPPFGVTDPLQPILEDIRSLLDDRVNYSLPPNSADRTLTLIPTGLETVIDNCCPGIAWVRVINVVPTVSFPSPANTMVGCPDTLFAANLELGVARCAAGIDDDGTIPIEVLDAEAVAYGKDRSALIQTVICDMAVYFDCKISLGAWEPLATEGGCYGSTVQVAIPYRMCCDPQAES
jgi:hypothetical protein